MKLYKTNTKTGLLPKYQIYVLTYTFYSHAMVLVRPNKQKSYATHTTLDTHVRKHIAKQQSTMGEKV